jgi:hypothetical protein
MVSHGVGFGRPRFSGATRELNCGPASLWDALGRDNVTANWLSDVSTVRQLASQLKLETNYLRMAE